LTRTSATILTGSFGGIGYAEEYTASRVLVDAAIAILAADHVVLSWNHRAETLTGYTPEALSGLNLIQSFEPPEMMHQMLLRMHAGELLVSARLHLRTADGRRLPVDVHCAPLRSPDWSEARMVLVMR
jgi:PAS domain S-box-containing protein